MWYNILDLDTDSGEMMEKVNKCGFCGKELEIPVSKFELALCAECWDYHNDGSSSPQGGRGAGVEFEKKESGITMAMAMAMAVGGRDDI